MKFGRIIVQINGHLLTSYFQDGGHEVRRAHTSAGCPLTRLARVMTLDNCMRYSSRSVLVRSKSAENKLQLILTTLRRVSGSDDRLWTVSGGPNSGDSQPSDTHVDRIAPLLRDIITGVGGMMGAGSGSITSE